MPSIRLALCQTNAVVGDFEGNIQKIVGALDQANTAGVDLAIFPELAVAGYPPEDLVLRSSFLKANANAIEKISPYADTISAVIGFVDGGPDGAYNASALVNQGILRGVYHKRVLPNYDVFDEQRNFNKGDTPVQLFEIAGVRVGMVICEDIWTGDTPLKELVDGGAELVVVINASPFFAGRINDRIEIVRDRIKENPCTVAYVNLVGGQDELVFDGGSFVMGPDGKLLVTAPQFSETNVICDIQVEAARRLSAVGLPLIECSETSRANDHRWPTLSSWLEGPAEIYEALKVGVHDYVEKNGFKDVVIGLSGGIDSSIVATIAVDALGPQRVHGVLMGSEFTSPESKEDAEELAKNLSIKTLEIPIDELRATFDSALGDAFSERETDVTEENLQSRIRGTLLMALSNKFGWMVLTTGNKSELATGYSTLYGDSVGGLAVIKDLLKTQVFAVSRFRNEIEDHPIPDRVLTKPPTAELRHGQRDDQSLPPYDQLDPIIEHFVERDYGVEDLKVAGFDIEVVRKVVDLINRAEYKRRQMPPGIRITRKAFGRDRRLPITNKFSD